MIDFSHVEYSYDGQAMVLHDVNLTIPQGQFVCILGGNGSGKSTLAKHINALLIPDAGSVTVLGMDTADTAHTFDIRSHAGMVFQNPDDQLVSSVVEDDVAFGPENLGIENPELRERVTKALHGVGLDGFEQVEVAALSGGLKQRVAIAGVLAMKPDILILDEASAMIDPRGRKGLARICRQLHGQGFTIISITHNMDEAAEADRVIVLDNGRVVMDASPEDVLTRADELKALRLEVPPTVELCLELQRQGVPVTTTLSQSDLEEQLCALLLTR